MSDGAGTKRKNDSGVRVVEMDDETLAFALENVDSNLRLGLAALQLGGRPEFLEKMVEMIEKFKRLRAALERAR